MFNNQTANKDDDTKKIFTTLILIFALMICTTGATYAYFALTATNNVATGTAATASLTLGVAEATLGGTSSGATQTTVMVPQLESALGTAMGTNYACVDGNGNIVCKVYTITVTNTSTSAVKLNGTIQFSGNENMPNLKFRRTTNATTLGSNTSVAVGNNTSTTWDIVATDGSSCVVNSGTCDEVSLAVDAAISYNFVVWIDETNDEQTDAGTWRANITFTGSNGVGVTSTITS